MELLCWVFGGWWWEADKRTSGGEPSALSPQPTLPSGAEPPISPLALAPAFCLSRESISKNNFSQYLKVKKRIVIVKVCGPNDPHRVISAIDIMTTNTSTQRGGACLHMFYSEGIAV